MLVARLWGISNVDNPRFSEGSNGVHNGNRVRLVPMLLKSSLTKTRYRCPCSMCRQPLSHQSPAEQLFYAGLEAVIVGVGIPRIRRIDCREIGIQLRDRLRATTHLPDSVFTGMTTFMLRSTNGR